MAGDDSEKRRPLRGIALQLAGAGLELGGTTAVLTLLGWWLDSRWGTGPGLLITGLVMGVTGGLYKMWRTSRRFF